MRYATRLKYGPADLFRPVMNAARAPPPGWTRRGEANAAASEKEEKESLTLTFSLLLLLDDLWSLGQSLSDGGQCGGGVDRYRQREWTEMDPDALD